MLHCRWETQVTHVGTACNMEREEVHHRLGLSPQLAAPSTVRNVPGGSGLLVADWSVSRTLLMWL